MPIGEVLTNNLFSWIDVAGNENTLDVDVVMNTNDKRSAKLTDHVVETGAVITDHVVIQPEELSLELVVSQTPITPSDGFESANISINAESRKLVGAEHPLKVRPSEFVPGGFLLLSQGVRTAITAAVGLITGAAGVGTTFTGGELETTSSSAQVSVLQATGGPVDRVGDVHDQLVDIMNNALLVTVSFKGRLYLDYLLTEVELVQAAGQAGMGRFKVTARAFRTVTGTRVALPDPADFRALPKANKGNKPLQFGDKGFIGPPPPPESIASKGFDAGGRTVTDILNFFGGAN